MGNELKLKLFENIVLYIILEYHEDMIHKDKRGFHMLWMNHD